VNVEEVKKLEMRRRGDGRGKYDRKKFRKGVGERKGGKDDDAGDGDGEGDDGSRGIAGVEEDEKRERERGSEERAEDRTGTGTGTGKGKGKKRAASRSAPASVSASVRKREKEREESRRRMAAKLKAIGGNGEGRSDKGVRESRRSSGRNHGDGETDAQVVEDGIGPEDESEMRTEAEEDEMIVESVETDDSDSSE
jgi:hypothetical protein